MLEVPNILLAICIVCNAALAVFIYRQKPNDQTNRLFAIFLIFVALWAAVLLGYSLVSDHVVALYLMKSSYVAALLIGVTFYFFSLYFPSGREPSRDHQLTIFLPTLVLILSIFSPDFLTEQIVEHSWGKETILGTPEYLTFAAFFGFLFGGGLLRLWWKQFSAEGITRVQLFAIASSVSIAGILGVYFNLILPSPLFQDFRLIWTGPLFTFVIAVTITYAIFRFKLFDLKAILAEVLVFSLWVFILIQTLLSSPGSERLVNIGLLAVVVVVGILLIRSVHTEVRNRERLEALTKDLEKANARLKELDRQKSEFIGIAAHQLRTPIAAIKGYSSLLLEGSYGKLTKKMQAPIKTIYDSSDRMADTIDDFLNVTRIEQGRMEYHKERVDLEKLIRNGVETFRLAAEAKGLSLISERNECKEEQHQILADTAKIQHVINNLLDNAIKYTNEGAITVRLVCDRAKKTVRMSVTDTGAGIPAKAIDGLFQKFVRAPNAKTVNVNGSGLGLFVAKQMIEAHGGRIWAESKGEGKGSMFAFELPLLPALEKSSDSDTITS